jgi:hypothetical protein
MRFKDLADRFAKSAAIQSWMRSAFPPSKHGSYTFAHKFIQHSNWDTSQHCYSTCLTL